MGTLEHLAYNTVHMQVLAELYVCVRCSLSLLLSGQLHVAVVQLDPHLPPQLYCSHFFLFCFSRPLQELQVPSCIVNPLSITLSLTMTGNECVTICVTLLPSFQKWKWLKVKNSLIYIWDESLKDLLEG